MSKRTSEYLKEKNFDVSQIPDEYLTQMRDLSKAKSVIEEISMIEDDIEEEGLVPTEGLGSKKRQAFAMEAQEKIMSLLESRLFIRGQEPFVYCTIFYQATRRNSI